jgi:hypothetical protein
MTIILQGCEEDKKQQGDLVPTPEDWRVEDHSTVFAQWREMARRDFFRERPVLLICEDEGLAY